MSTNTTNGVAEFVAAAAVDGEQGLERLSDADLAAVMTAAISVYTRRAEATENYPPPIIAEKATATEVVTVVSEMLRAVNVNMFDLSMWFRRPRG